jgi:hypothetical protein
MRVKVAPQRAHHGQIAGKNSGSPNHVLADRFRILDSPAGARRQARVTARAEESAGIQEQSHRSLPVWLEVVERFIEIGAVGKA